ncbi:integrase, partial [Tannerella sp. oral taxon BU063 isolate Cell 2]
MDDMKMKVLLYLKKSSRDRSGKAPIMGRITLGRSIAQFSCKLSCNSDLWNPRESRMDGKSREAVEVNGRLDNLLLAVQASYQSLLAKGSPFDATDIKEHFQGSVQNRTMLLERFDGLIVDMEEHVGVDIKRESLVLYRQTRMRLQQFIRAKHNASDLTFSQLTEDFVKQFEQFATGEVGLKQSTCYNMVILVKKVCKLAYREGAADSLLFDNVHV